MEVVETLMLEVLACRGRVKEENDGFWGRAKRWVVCLGGGVG